MSLAAGAYGPVEVIRGRFRGQVGYYDDDDERGQCVVYFAEPLSGPYELIDRRHLRPTAAAHLPTERWVRQYPDAARRLGVERRQYSDS